MVSDYAKRYQNLISRILKDEETGADQLRYLDSAEREQLIYVTGQNKKEFPVYENTLDMIESAAGRFPDRIALQDEVSCLNYQELIRKVHSLAVYLRKSGVKKGDPVIVYMEKRLEVVVAFLAVMKAGGIYVPVDVSFPRNRVTYILECVSSGWIITTGDLAEKENFLKNGICIDRIFDEIPMTGWEYTDGNVKLKDSAYIIFTSGSTGNPKGVEIQHQALVNFLQSMEVTLGLRDKKEVTIGGVTSISFDISILEFLLPLIVGGKSALFSKRAAADSKLFQECIRRFSVNIFQATATTWKMILKTGWEGNKAIDVLVGGEMVSKDLAQELILKFQNVWNVYGPTEATIWATVKRLSAQDAVVSAGFPLHNMEAYILDEDFKVMQKNVPGKLYLSGTGLCKGYYKREELTRERFFEVCFDGISKRLYDTGDLAKYLENGEIQIIGRTDDQVKLSGYRIELGEIESVLNLFAGISGSAVIIKDQRLVAYITCKPDCRDISFHTLREYCKKELTAYMIPSEFILLDFIPATPNQKVDKRALAAMQGRRLTSGKEGAAVSDSVYGEMANIWKEVLGDFETGLDDNFFDIGGSSLLAMLLQQKLKEYLNAEVTVLDIFTYPTIHMLNDYIRGEMKEESSKNPEALQQGKNRLKNLRKRRNYKE
jgi:amino acid adenylation domain-containing protein